LPHQQVRQAILQTTRQLYLAKGYAGTSTDEIAALSSVSKQTIYRHFADKEDLVVAMLRDTVTASEARSADEFEALAGTDDLRRDLQLFARRHIKEVIQPHVTQMRRRIIGDADRFPDLAREWYNALKFCTNEG
jgi:TetR/AcrR family transcriptional regulator, mexJK operon transcriptional repressor